MSRIRAARLVFAILGSTLVTTPLLAVDRPDMVVADFEQETYGAWQADGEAFGPGPAKGTLPGQMPVSGFEGERLVNTFYNGDGTTGTLMSPEFRLERKHLNFLIGGGGYPGETCLNLLIDGQVVRTATGPNTEAGGSEELDWHTWDVAEFFGKTAAIQIVDRRTGGWGHINVDQIVQSDARRQAEPARREIVIEHRYLHLPVKTGARKQRMRFDVDGRTVREFEIELAEGEPDFHVFSDVSAWRGKALSIQVDRLPADSRALAAIKASNEAPGNAESYRESRRPQFHFTSRRGWLNDPNGLVYHDGQYHLFYQHNPYGWNWGNMHWGHAVSADLLHWNELGEALYPRQFGDWCFSGSAIVSDISPFGGIDQPILIAFYTSTGRGECVAFSKDNGKVWTEFDGNPVVKHAGRDPKVIWHTPTSRWIMAVYDETEGRQIAFYSSKTLHKWTLESRIPDFFECPDLFELPVDGDPGNTRWVLYAADGKYVVGRFDGHAFTVESGKHQLWHGNFYAAQTYSDAPQRRRIQIGWGQGITFPGMPFNQQMTIPVELTLRSTEDGPRMFAEPVSEVASLRGDKYAFADIELRDADQELPGFVGHLFDVELNLQPGTARQMGITFGDVAVTYDAEQKSLGCGQATAPLTPVEGHISLRILVDRGSVEVFGNGGQVALSVGATLPDEPFPLQVFARGGQGVVRAAAVYRLRSVWLE
jgi:fructan beta-fructosidase